MVRRIVSLVPSWTETLAAWGLQSEIVGCTQFCVAPASLHRTAAKVGGTKDFSVEAIRNLNPTHIIANREENPKEPIEILSAQFPLLLTYPRGPLDVAPTLRDMGKFLGEKSLAERDASAIEQAIDRLQGESGLLGLFLYFIWREPYMIAGPDTYISRLLELGGWQNAYQGEERYPSLSIGELQELKADFLLFSSEPYPFRRRDVERLRMDWSPLPQSYKVDGMLFSWYGKTTLLALNELQRARKDDRWSLGNPIN